MLNHQEKPYYISPHIFWKVYKKSPLDFTVDLLPPFDEDFLLIKWQRKEIIALL